MKKTEELRSKFDAIFDKNLTEVDNWNSAVFYSDKQKFINELLEAINYTRCSLQLKDKEVISFDDWLKDNCEKLHGALYRYKDNVLDRYDMRYVYMREVKQCF